MCIAVTWRRYQAKRSIDTDGEKCCKEAVVVRRDLASSSWIVFKSSLAGMFFSLAQKKVIGHDLTRRRLVWIGKRFLVRSNRHGSLQSLDLAGKPQKTRNLYDHIEKDGKACNAVRFLSNVNRMHNEMASTHPAIAIYYRDEP